MSPAARLSYEFCGLTDCGRVRKNNEDAVAVDTAHGLALLADGMGGYNAGEVASSMAISVTQHAMVRWFNQQQEPGLPATSAVRQALQESVQQANMAVLKTSLLQPQCAGMGTTLVVAVFSGDRLVLGHMGDSRCYRLRAGQLQQLTRDHSWLQEQLDAGLMTPQEAAQSGYGNLVTSALGVEEETPLDINEFQVQPLDLFLLCSDGLSDMLDDHELLMLSNSPDSLEEKTRRLVDTANAMGGRDNISVVLVQAHIQGRSKSGLISRLLQKKAA